MEILISLKGFLRIVLKQKLFFWKRNLFLLLVIVATSILLSTFNNNHEVTMTETLKNFEKQEASQLYDQNNLANKTIYFTPNNKITEDIMYKVQLTLRLDSHHVQAVENESKLQEIVGGKSNDQVIIIRFDTKYNTTALQPTNITYEIQVCRNETNMSEKYLKSDQDSYPESYDKTDLPYRGSGFLTLQLVIDAKIIDNFAKNRADFDITISKYPQLAGARPIKINIAPVAYTLVFILILFCVIVVLLDDTRKFVYQELLKNNWQHRYLYVNYVVDLTQVTLMLIVFFAIFAIFNVFGFINNIILLSITILFSVAIMSYTCFLQAIFTSMTFAATNVIIWTLLCCLMPILIFQRCNGFILEKFFPMNIFLRGMDLFEVSINTDRRFIEDDILQLTLAPIFCSVFYLVLLVINFGSIKKYVKRQLFKAKNKSVEYFEQCEKIEMPEDELTCIKINKICGKNKKLRKFSLNIYANQITALLGCNVAEKSTILRILAGKIPRSSGQILRNYETEIVSFSQYDFVIPYLTCKEQLLFMSQLSGVSEQDATTNVNEILQVVGLENEANILTCQLTKLQKRCLLLANAKLGGVMLILLDDPTLELDEADKVKFQKVLLHLKQTTTILIATNCMVEAEALADRVAIMTEGGRVVEHGSQKFFKNGYAREYILKMLKASKDTFDSNRVLNFICEKSSMKPTVKQSLNDSYFSVVLMCDTNYDYYTLLESLESNKNYLEIKSIDHQITNITLEKIFSKSLAHQNDPSKSPNVPSDVQRALLICQNWMYRKSNWISLVLMILLITICFLLIFLPNINSIKMQPKKIQDPIIVLIPHTAFDITEMQTIVRLFQDNTERRHAKFKVLNNVTTDNYIETIASTNITKYNENLVAVYEVSLAANKKISIEIFYSRNIVDNVSIALNLVSNVLVQYYSEKNQTIDIMNAPISRGFRSAVYF